MILLKGIKEKWNLKNITIRHSIQQINCSITLLFLFIYFLLKSRHRCFFCSNHIFLIIVFTLPILSFSPTSNNLAIELPKINNKWLSHYTVLPQANKCYPKAGTDLSSKRFSFPATWQKSLTYKYCKYCIHWNIVSFLTTIQLLEPYTYG